MEKHKIHIISKDPWCSIEDVTGTDDVCLTFQSSEFEGPLDNNYIFSKDIALRLAKKINDLYGDVKEKP